MPRKNRTKQFKCEVVALYESTAGTTVNAIAAAKREHPRAEGLSDAEHI